MSFTLCIKVMRRLAHLEKSGCIYIHIGVSRKLFRSLVNAIATATNFGPCISDVREEPGKLALEVARSLLLKGLFIKEATMPAVLCNVQKHRSVSNLFWRWETPTRRVVKERVITGIDHQRRYRDPLQHLPRVNLHSQVAHAARHARQQRHRTTRTQTHVTHKQ